MGLFNVFALLIVLSACFSFINHKYLRLPKTIGLMLISLLISLSLLALQYVGIDFVSKGKVIVESIDFSETVLRGVLCFLLFAGALHVDLSAFLKQRWPIGVLATLGVLFSTAIVGTGMYFLLPLVGFSLPFLVCLLFGALISPTDPIAVLSLLKVARVPKGVEMKVAGEALLNDGVSVVIFLLIFGLMQGTTEITWTGVLRLLSQEVLGGIIVGLGIGFVAYALFRRVDDYAVETLLSLALVFGGNALAAELHVSGPLAIVAAGLFIGNHGRKYAMSEKTRERLDGFWELVDDILNNTLFVLVGFEALLLNVKPAYVIAGLLAIPLVLSGRLVSVWLSSQIAGLVKKFSRHSVLILTWGGLRGGISFALALALPQGEARDAILLTTYMVVVFSILVQGLSMGTLLKKLNLENEVARS